MDNIEGRGQLVGKSGAFAPVADPAGSSNARGYLASARALLPGLQELARTSQRPDLSASMAMLGGHILECALKSVISHRVEHATEQVIPHKGKLSDKLKKHDLEWLWIEAHSAGLKLSPQPADWCKRLSGLHDRPYHLRYPTTHVRGLMDAGNPWTLQVEEIVAAAGKHVGS